MIWGPLDQRRMRWHANRQPYAWSSGYQAGRDWSRTVAQDEYWQSWLGRLVQEPRTSNADVRAISKVIRDTLDRWNLPKRHAQTAFINGFKFAVTEASDAARDEVLRRAGYTDAAERAKALRLLGFYDVRRRQLS